MSYQRVIPRDLFNESNLLKCYGQLYLNLEKMNCGAELLYHDYGQPFDVCQNAFDGSIYLDNVEMTLRDGTECYLSRPLNSREPWPLYLTLEPYEVIPVFNDDGTFSAEMITFLEGRP